MQARDDSGQRRLCGGETFVAELRTIPAAQAALRTALQDEDAQGAVHAAAEGLSAADGGSEVVAVGRVEGRVEDKDDGTHHVTYCSTRAGVFHLHLRMETNTIEGERSILPQTACD